MNVFGSILKVRVSNCAASGGFWEKMTAYSSMEYRMGLSATLVIASRTSASLTFLRGGLMRTMTLLMSSGSGGGKVICCCVVGSIVTCAPEDTTFGLIKKLIPSLSGSRLVDSSER